MGKHHKTASLEISLNEVYLFHSERKFCTSWPEGKPLSSSFLFLPETWHSSHSKFIQNAVGRSFQQYEDFLSCRTMSRKNNEKISIGPMLLKEIHFCFFSSSLL